MKMLLGLIQPTNGTGKIASFDIALIAILAFGFIIWKYGRR
jgi:hypothetical protein